MKHLVSDRKMRRLLHAEKACQALREYITAPASSNPNLGHAHDLLLKWFNLAPSRIAYGDSHKPVPKTPK
jgi:hypothetical protein